MFTLHLSLWMNFEQDGGSIPADFLGPLRWFDLCHQVSLLIWEGDRKLSEKYQVYLAMCLQSSRLKSAVLPSVIATK